MRLRHALLLLCCLGTATARAAAPSSADALVDQAAGQLDDGQPRKACGTLQAALRADPRNARAHMEMARCELKSSGLDTDALAAAETWLKKALALDPQLGNAYVLLGYVHTHQHYHGSARDAFAKARANRADSPWLEHNEAELLKDQGKTVEAKAEFARIGGMAAVPAQVRISALENLARLHARDHEVAQAQRAYLEQLAIAPGDRLVAGEYSEFLRVRMLDLAESEKWARASDLTCQSCRRSLGRTLYLLWAQALIEERNPAKAELYYKEARAYVSDPADVLHEIADYPRPHAILAALKANGHSLDHFPELPDADGFGTPPLTAAVASGNRAIVQQLVQLGADVDRLGYQGMSSIAVAAKVNNLAMVELLLSLGADPFKASGTGKDARWFAETLGHTAIVRAIDRARPHGATTLARDPGRPFRVGYVYRVRGDTPPSDYGVDFRAGEKLTFVGYGRYVDASGAPIPDVVRCDFGYTYEGQLRIKDWGVDKAQMASWSHHFEELGPSEPDIERAD
jgi:Tfp pilus assembly protein PilF